MSGGPLDGFLLKHAPTAEVMDKALTFYKLHSGLELAPKLPDSAGALKAPPMDVDSIDPHHAWVMPSVDSTSKAHLLMHRHQEASSILAELERKFKKATTEAELYGGKNEAQNKVRDDLKKLTQAYKDSPLTKADEVKKASENYLQLGSKIYNMKSNAGRFLYENRKFGWPVSSSVIIMKFAVFLLGAHMLEKVGRHTLDPASQSAQACLPAPAALPPAPVSQPNYAPAPPAYAPTAYPQRYY